MKNLNQIKLISLITMLGLACSESQHTTPSGDQTTSVQEGTTSSYYEDPEKYLTPVDKIDQFDLLVNHCPETKMLEFGHFDEE